MAMCTRKIYFFYIVMKLVCPCSCHCSNEIPNFKMYGSSKSSLGKGHSFKDLSISDKWLCMEFCCRYSLCRSVDLNRGQKRCKLNVQSAAEAPGLLVSAESTYHIDKINFPKMVANDCFNHSCDNSSIYIENTGCVHVLVKTCGPPPGVPNIEGTIPLGPFSVGHTHNYGPCAQRYVPFWEPYTTCQDDGRWSDVVYQCLDKCIVSGNSRIGSWCYYLSNVQRNHQQASDMCSARGMYMPRIETSTEWSALKPYLVHSYWISGYAEYTFWPHREYYWAAGYRIGYRPWAPKQPDNMWLNQFKIRISSNGWDDENDGSVFYVMCEIDY